MMKYAKRTYILGPNDNRDFPEWHMQPGMRVVFDKPNGGYPESYKKGLVKGKTYTLRDVDVDRAITYVELEEVEGYFNSAHFSVVDSLEEFINNQQRMDPEIERVALENAWELARRDD